MQLLTPSCGHHILNVKTAEAQNDFIKTFIPFFIQHLFPVLSMTPLFKSLSLALLWGQELFICQGVIEIAEQFLDGHLDMRAVNGFESGVMKHGWQ